MKWIKDLVSPAARRWEEFYRNRWQHDKVIRSTHGVNCTGGCSWNIYVKDGIVTWEMQALDYPAFDAELPPYEPRGCQRGISYSWYLYSPIRIKYPYVRGALLDIWRDVRSRHDDPVEAWAAIQADPELRSRYQRARGKGGFRRTTLEESIDICAAANIHTIKKWGPDRLIGFSPIPAMSQVSYAAGARMLQLLGGVNLSFYDWYCDLPPASPEVWGEQTDVAESADWYNSKMIAVMGSNPNMTRTPDCHYLPAARQNGTKLVVFSPDFSQVSKYADQWVPIHAGQDGAFWMAVTHVLLNEFHHKSKSETFTKYVEKYSDAPYLVELVESERGFRAGQMLRAGRLQRYTSEEHGEWKFLLWDRNSDQPRMPGGAAGHRWATKPGKWNLKLEDPVDGAALAPELTFLDRHDEVPLVEFEQYDLGGVALRGVPARRVRLADGREVRVTTVFDLLMARYGVGRGLEGEYPRSYADADFSYTPAWQERLTGIDAKTVLSFTREWARTAEATNGKCCIIIGAGINHWYHNNLMYRAAIAALMLTGCVGKNGGGLNHYVGQEKLAPMAPWSFIAFARDWTNPPRLQNAPSWHYVHSDQWRYEADFTDYHPVPEGATLAKGHTMDLQLKAVRNGWLPSFPQFNESSIEVVRKARAAGATSEKEIIAIVVERLKSGDLQFAMQDPDAPENWPRTWYIWRGNALMSSAKGHEYFLKHYLGTHHNAIAKERAEGHVDDVTYRPEAPIGKFDLIIDLNFRMDTSALYSDIVLPAATWYEKADLNSTDMHSYIHPLSEAVPPAWESRSDWDLFRAVTARTAELALRHLPGPVEDLVMTPLQHDTPAEISQPTVKDWAHGECEAIPGKTMPHFKVVTRNYPLAHQQFTALGPGMRKIGAHGIHMDITEEYDEHLKHAKKIEVAGVVCPSIREAVDVAEAILALAPETNGEIAWKGYRYLEERTGLSLTHLADGSRSVRTSYKDLQAQPRRLLNSPCWSGLMSDEKGGRAYTAFISQVEHLVPWRTLTGRQHFYLDHTGYIDFGENLPVYKPVPPPNEFGDLLESPEEGLMLNFLTPHGKWHIHSTYSDNHRMLTLSRGCEPCWLNEKDADSIGVEDNDWVEVHNDHGVVVTRAVVTARLPRGICIIYHSPERTIGVPKSPLRKGRRAGGHNSLTRVRLKPSLMVGGYGQFTYHFNYWGPTGVNRDTFVRVRKLDKVEL